MKKTALIVFCSLIFILHSQAQTNHEKKKDKKVKFGLRTGYEFQANDSNLEYRLQLPYIGALSDLWLSKKWSLQLELNLRSEKREELLSNSILLSYDELYLTVPVLLKYSYDDKFKIYAGTQVLSASLVNNIYGLKKWNGILGAEYDLSKKLFMETRFRHGFEGRKSINNFRDNRISIGIGYKF